jgi:hypothetical protein
MSYLVPNSYQTGADPLHFQDFDRGSLYGLEKFWAFHHYRYALITYLRTCVKPAAAAAGSCIFIQGFTAARCAPSPPPLLPAVGSPLM